MIYVGGGAGMALLRPDFPSVPYRKDKPQGVVLVRRSLQEGVILYRTLPEY